jgi:adenine/guanine phosphoribosyltransferase-like PRPP-binding protein
MAHNSWLKEVFYPSRLKRSAHIISKQILRDHKLFEYKAIACTGLSGVSMGTVVSYLTGIPLMVVRKPKENHHGNYELEYSDYHIKHGNYCIVDDLIDSGNTMNTIKEKVGKEGSFILCKIYLYHPLEWNKDNEYKGTPVFRAKRIS